MKNIIKVGLLFFAFPLTSISTTMNHRLVSSAPLQYKQIDYFENLTSFEIEPWYSKMFNPEHVMENLGINEQSSVMLNELGFGDINPQYILLENADNSYTSMMNLTPELYMFGALLHFYKQYEYVFFDIKTAILHCKTIVNIEEGGGGDGNLQNITGETIYNAYDAFTQDNWKYGKLGDVKRKTGLDNIQLTLGLSNQNKSIIQIMESLPSSKLNIYLAGFALMEIPTGTGTKSEWLFEPQVGNNHWSFGFGTDFMALTSYDISVVVGGNYRYILSNWEIRSFDLTNNGQWSRYLDTQLITNLSTESTTSKLQGINLFTQEALIDSKNQINIYTRMQKKHKSWLFELGYNFFYNQKETISKVNNIENDYGILNVDSNNSNTTASTATIGQAIPIADQTPVTLTTNDLDLSSGAAGPWTSNTFAFRLQKAKGSCAYGFGASVDIASSAQAISTWSLWANFEILFFY